MHKNQKLNEELKALVEENKHKENILLERENKIREMDTTGLNLPAIKKGGALEKAQPKKSISTLDLSKKTAVSSVMKTETVSIQKEILQSEKGLDLVLVGDLTGSMSQYHSLLKRKFLELSKDLFAMVDNLKIRIIFYLDRVAATHILQRCKN